MTAFIDWLKRYWGIVATAAASVLYLLLKGRNQQIDTLKAEAATNTALNHLEVAKNDQQHAQKQATESNASYDALLRDNADLATKLGIGHQSDSNRDPKNH